MSKTGTYAYRGGRIVKISDKIPTLRSPVFFPRRSQRRCGAYIDPNLGHEPVVVKDKDHKREIMKREHLKEVG